MENLRRVAERYAQMHKNICEHWREGDVISVWRDENKTLCIKYESGKWWHYRITNGQLEFW